MITCAISACKWLYRKENRQIGERPLLIRQYMDLRNQYQSQALRVRANTDIQTLEKQHRWIEWPQFTACVSRLRDEWEQSDKTISFDSAWRLMLLLLLGLYSCIPARGKEVRLLQYIPKRKLSDQRQQHSLKRFVEKKQINLVTEGEEDQEWMLFISQYKNYRWRGVESCELSAFGWWTDLLQLYLSEYREELVARPITITFSLLETGFRSQTIASLSLSLLDYNDSQGIASQPISFDRRSLVISTHLKNRNIQ
jgi:hypothetical protein